MIGKGGSSYLHAGHGENGEDENNCVVCNAEYSVESSLSKDHRIVVILFSAMLLSIGLFSSSLLLLCDKYFLFSLASVYWT